MECPVIFHNPLVMYQLAMLQKLLYDTCSLAFNCARLGLVLSILNSLDKNKDTLIKYYVENSAFTCLCRLNIYKNR